MSNKFEIDEHHYLVITNTSKECTKISFCAYGQDDEQITLFTASLQNFANTLKEFDTNPVKYTTSCLQETIFEKISFVKYLDFLRISIEHDYEDGYYNFGLKCNLPMKYLKQISVIITRFVKSKCLA